jgi:hypothetical protein
MNQLSDEEVERIAFVIATALDETLDGCVLIGESWPPTEGTQSDRGKLLMTVDGRIDLRGLARVAIEAVRAGA